MAVSKEGMLASYVFQFAILLAIMTNLTHYFAANPPASKNNASTHTTTFQKVSNFMLAPATLMAVSTALIIIAPFKNMAFNICLSAFQKNPNYFDAVVETVLDLSFAPCFSTKMLQIYTIVAYVLMGMATAKQTRMVEKLSKSVSIALKGSNGAGKSGLQKALSFSLSGDSVGAAKKADGSGSDVETDFGDDETSSLSNVVDIERAQVTSTTDLIESEEVCLT